MYRGNINDLKNNLKKFFDLVLAGNVVTIMKRNVPIAKIVPIESKAENSTKLGAGKGSVKILGDLTEPLIPEQDWDMHQ